MAGRSRAASRKSSRSRSRPRHENDLHRLYSATHINDASVYGAERELDPDHPEQQFEDTESVEQHQDRHEQQLEETESLERHETDSTRHDSDYREDAVDEKYVEKPSRAARRASHISDEVFMGIPDERDIDLEAGPPLEKKVTTKDPNLVTFDGPDDPANPKNWTFKTRWAATVIVSAFTLISPVSSSMVAPALPAIGRDLGISSDVELSLTLSIFVLAYAVGPFFLGPLSEIYGRVPVLQLANAFYFVWNLACGFAQNKGELIAFRFLAGLGGSAPLACGGAVLADCWKPEERGKAMSIYALAPLLGPAIGPIAGGFIAENTTWRWCFWATSIATVLIQGLGLMFLRETYTPKILLVKARKLRKETGNMQLHTEYENGQKFVPKMQVSLKRPFILLGTQPIVQVLALYMAYMYGLMYLVLSTFPTLWTETYHEAVGVGSLNYISLGVGFTAGVQICAPINDRIYRRLKKRNDNIGKPEFRVPLLLPGGILVPIGLFWYGWSAQAHIHWIMPNIGAAIFAAGTIMGFQCIQTYIVDSYTKYAASALAAAAALRSLAGFGFPLFAPYMYSALGDGWGNSLLGFISIGLGIPAPFLLWFYGEKLRNRSKFAAGS